MLGSLSMTASQDTRRDLARLGRGLFAAPFRLLRRWSARRRGHCGAREATCEMSCVQHSLEGYFVPWGESERAVVPEERLSPSARDTLARLRTLRLLPAGLCACFVATTVARRDAEHLGSAALALLQTGMLARTSSAPEGRTLAHVAHARGATLLFLALAVGKSYALLLVRRETCLVLRARPCDPLEWASLAFVACFAYVSYVASLAYQRLIHAYLIASFPRCPDERAESGDAPAREPGR